MRTPSRPLWQATTLLFALVGITSAQEAPAPSLEVVKARAAGVVFDTVLGAADAQPLIVRGGRRFGWAKVEPRQDAYELTDEQVEHGLVIARISAESAYAPLGLGRGTNWWWLDRTDGKFRSIIYSEALNSKNAITLDSLRSHPGYQWQQSIARFVFFDIRAALWIVIGPRCLPHGTFSAGYWDLDRANPWGAPSKLR